MQHWQILQKAQPAAIRKIAAQLRGCVLEDLGMYIGEDAPIPRLGRRIVLLTV
jgi:hypothetical protein